MICISENTQRDLVRLFGIDPARTSVVHLGYSLTTETNAAKVESGERRPSLLYVGNRRGYKNFRTLLQAYGSSPILREFELIAFGGHRLLPGEQKEIRRLGITDRVRFESGSDRELAARYRAAAAFIYPSKYEGFGISPLEAMSHGCPVVCSNAGPIPEVVGDAGVYFDPNNAEELRAALERVVTTEAVAGGSAGAWIQTYHRVHLGQVRGGDRTNLSRNHVTAAISDLRDTYGGGVTRASP